MQARGDAGAAQTAVIIEDDPDIRHLLEEVLSAAGFSTISAGNGLDGVQAVLNYQPVVTTLDVNLPGIDGFEVARRIRAQSDTYIIMTTALAEEADVLIGLGAGADDYIVKPFRPRELRARIEAMLRRPRFAGAVPPSQGQVGPSFPNATPRADAAPAAAYPGVGADPAAAFGAVQPGVAQPGFVQPGAVQPGVVQPGPVPPEFVAPPAAPPVVAQPIIVPPAGAPGVPHPGFPVQGAPNPLAPGVAPLAPGSELARVGEVGDWIEHRGLRLSSAERLVMIDGQQVDLTRTEFDLLEALLHSQRRVRSKADLALLLRGESYVTSYLVGDADKRAIEAHMTNLRRRIGDSATNPRFIETVRGVGYRLTPKDTFSSR